MNYLTAILLLILVAAAAVDLKSQKIPNVITLPSIVFALGYHTVWSGVDGFLFSLLGTLSGIGLLILPYLMGGMGAGDAKLMGAVGAFLGAKGVFGAFIASAIAGGAYALLLIAFSRQFSGYLRELFNTVAVFISTRQYKPDNDRNSSRPKLSYGLAIGLGSAMYILNSQWGLL